MILSDYLGKPASLIIDTTPFNKWSFERSIDEDTDDTIIQYISRGHALSLSCDHNEIVNSIFLESNKHNENDDSFFDIPFNWTREKVISHFGVPTKSGAELSDPVLGEYGAWDRFSFEDYTIHFQYAKGEDVISIITLMLNGIVPEFQS